MAFWDRLRKPMRGMLLGHVFGVGGANGWCVELYSFDLRSAGFSRLDVPSACFASHFQTKFPSTMKIHQAPCVVAMLLAEVPADPHILEFWYVQHILQHMVLIQGYARRSIIETCSPQRRPPMIWSSFLKTSRCALCYCTEIFGTEILQEQSNRSPAITSFRFAFKHPCRLTGM